MSDLDDIKDAVANLDRVDAANFRRWWHAVSPSLSFFPTAAGTEPGSIESIGDPPYQYYRLVILASHPATEIRLGDLDGFLVVHAAGRMDESLLEGAYTVQFGPDDATYPILLTGPVDLTESRLRSGPHYRRPVLRLL
jgi:hypothetical protein